MTPPLQARCTLHAGASLSAERQIARPETLFADERHVEVEVTHGTYQRVATLDREPDRKRGKFFMQHVINAFSTGVPAALIEIRKLGDTMSKRAADILAHFDRPEH